MRIQGKIIPWIIYLCIQLDLVNSGTNPRIIEYKYPVIIATGTVRTHNGYESGLHLYSQKNFVTGWPLDELRKLIRVTCVVPHSTFLLPRNAKANEIYIENCKIYKTPLKEVLESYQIDFTALEKLQFVNTFMDTPYPKGFTAGLPLQSLEMINLTNFHVTEDFFTSLTRLRELIFADMEVPVLPPSKSLHLESLVLKNSSLKKWSNCETLQQLAVDGLQKEHIPSWPSNCTQLKILRLQSMPLEAVYHLTKSMSTSSVDNFVILSITNCSLQQLPLYLMQSQNFKEIYFSDNDLNDDAILQFPTMKTLEILDLSNNKGIISNIPGVLSRVPGLRELNLNGTGIYSWTDSFPVREAVLKLPSLTKLQLRWQFAKEDVFMHSRFKKLTHLTMTNHYPRNTWEHLRLHSFPSTGAQQLEVDVRGIPVRYVSIGPEYAENFERIPSSRFWLTNKGYKLIVHIDSVDCECKNHVLARALREYPHFLAMPDLKCHHGGPFLDEPVENLNCRKATVNGCVRRMSRQRNYTTVVDCSRNTKQFRWPQPQGFRGFNASSNSITSLDRAYLPDTLKWLDLRNNSISRLNGEQSMRLFGNKGRRVWLAGNPIVCDCDNQALLDALHVNQSLVMDYDNLTCADSRKPLRLVFVAELCRPKLVMVSVTVSLLAVLLLIAALLVRHYWTSLRMILYAHGCCMSCLREEDVDQDRPYDAFLSFAHGDDDYVMQKLLPQLEGEPNCYKICVHYRDWSVGEWIPAQIMQSVRLSKRTIIVLSKNFVKSCWGVLEFRHANAGAAADGRKRLLVLVLDDILSEKLSPELQGYLELNTYLDCKDPWFWEKLRYAMPHKDSKEQDRRNCKNLSSQMYAHRHYNNTLYSEETLSMPEIHSIDTLHGEEVPARPLNVVISSE